MQKKNQNAIFRESWRALCNSLNLEESKSQTALSFLMEQYTAPTRYYHTIEHINQMLEKVEFFKTEFSNINAVKVATFFHDVVYDVSRKDNEEQSAAIAVAFLKNVGAEQTLIEDVEKMIQATKSHKETESTDTNLLLDIDMSILAAERTTYLEYASSIMKEYEQAYIPEECKTGRLGLFLEKVLASDKIFLTKTFSLYEEKARKNLSHEMKILRHELSLTGINNQRLE